MKRREFFTQSVSAGAASVMAPAMMFAGTNKDSASGSASIKPQNKGWFEELLGERFLFRQEGQEPITARLVGVHVVPGSPKHEQFSVEFRVTDGRGQGGLFQVENPKAGSFQLMVSPGGTLKPRQTHLAHFSLLKQS